MTQHRPGNWLTRAGVVYLAIMGSALITACSQRSARHEADKATTKFRGLLGSDSKKIKRTGDKTFIWAGGGDPASAGADWYEFTGSAIPPEQLQFGIGKDRIRAIDDPVYVNPDDPRLLTMISISHYRKDEKPETNDEIMVSGFEVGGEARAFPTALLDHHELVNDRIGGKPVTVGW